MLFNAPVTIPNYASESGTVSIPTHPNGRSSQLNSFLFLASTRSSQCDVEKVACIMHDKRAQVDLEIGHICGCADPVDDGVPVIQTPKKLSIGTLDNHSWPVLPTLSRTISHGSGGVDRLSLKSRNLVKHSHGSVFDDGPEEMAIPPRTDEEPVVTTTLPWYSRIFASFTIYGELSVAGIPEEFALLRMRLQQEWSFSGGFLVGFAAINTAMFAMPSSGTLFKVDSYACTAVAISSAACGLGIACDVWFLLRYIWVDLKTFISRSHDVYGSYVFFSLSSRVPTFCTLISSISLLLFVGLVAYDARPLGVVVIGVLVILVMMLQFIVYGTHYCATFALRVWRARAVRASEV